MRKLEFDRTVKAYMEEWGMLQAGDRLIVALSGGADSVCLLCVLANIPELDGNMRALHVHHGLRGDEADRDELFVRRLCEGRRIPLTVVHRDVRRYAAAHGLSEEEAGRILRYEALEEAAQEWEREAAQEWEQEAAQEWKQEEAAQEREQEEAAQERERRKAVQECGQKEAAEGRHQGADRLPRPGSLVKIAVAHHQDDHAETIFHHLLRGSGLRGLTGMRPVQGRRIRPLLCVRRADILEYLRSEGQGWCEDSTNGEPDYTRNRIRNEIFPLLIREVNSHAVENILHAGELFSQADDYLEQQAGKVLSAAGGLDAGRAKIRLKDFLAQEQIIRSYILRLMLDQAAPGQKNITARHFAQLERLAGLPVGSCCDLPGELFARRDYEYLWIERGKGLSQKPGAGKKPADQGEMLKFCTFSHEKGMEIPKNQYTKWFDYDKIKGTLSVRTRQSGDYLTLAGGGRKPLNRYMIDEKIPRQERDQILLLAEGHHILWVIGYRISEYYKITEETQTILQAVKNGGERDGRQNSGIIVRGGSGPQDQ